MNSGFVWLASYPKSGNTWLRLFLECVLNGGAEIDINRPAGRSPIAASRQMFDTLLDVDSSDLMISEIERARPSLYRAWAAELDRPQAIKVHDAWSMTDQSEPLFPPEVTVASFYIVRDPRDVAVSLVHHFGRSLDEVIEIMAKTDARSGQINDLTFERQLSQRLKTWSQHVSSWIDQQGVELLRYEDMISDPAGNLGRAARMLQPSISEKVILRAVEATDFGRLQAQEQRNGFVERVPGQASFFRSGRSGGWREVFSAAQANRLENDHRSIMECLGYL